MNREIEFRVYDKKNKQMRYDITGFECSRNVVDGVFIDGDYFNLDDGVLMQYTCLKDKNGKKIFEEDIVKNNEYTLAVVYNPRTQSFVLIDENEWLNSSSDRIYDCDDIDEKFIDNHFEYNCGSYEVIGNTYEGILESEGDNER